MNEPGYFYLASPYSHPDPDMMQARYEAARDMTAVLANSGIFCFCPIAHTHDMAKANHLPTNFEFWDNWNQAMIRGSCGIIVLKLTGWEESKGVTAELQFARSIGKPILWMGEFFE